MRFGARVATGAADGRRRAARDVSDSSLGAAALGDGLLGGRSSATVPSEAARVQRESDRAHHTHGHHHRVPDPTPDSQPVSIAAWPTGGARWFTEFNASQLGRISTDGVISELATPTPGSGPAGIAPGPESQGSVWFTEVNPNKVARLMEPLPAALTEPVGRGPGGVAAKPLTLEELNAKDPPTLGKDVNVGPRKGQIFISVAVGRGASARARRTVPGFKGRRFVPLTEARQIPVGSRALLGGDGAGDGLDTTDRCDGTLTAVTRGKVAVRDFRRKRSILVRQGKRYLAQAPR